MCRVLYIFLLQLFFVFFFFIPCAIKIESVYQVSFSGRRKLFLFNLEQEREQQKIYIVKKNFNWQKNECERRTLTSSCITRCFDVYNVTWWVETCNLQNLYISEEMKKRKLDEQELREIEVSYQLVD